MRPVINKKNKSEIVLIGNDDIGSLYLEKRWFISVGERLSIDEHEAKRQKAGIIAAKLMKRISQDKNISIEEAQELLSPRRAADGTTIDNSAIIYDYIEDFTELNTLSAVDGVSVSTAIATTIIQERAAYPVECLELCELNGDKLKIAPSPFYLKDRQEIKFGSCVVSVRGNHPIDSELIKVAPVSEKINPSVGFLWTGKRYFVGSDEWTEKDTKELNEDLVSKIFEFYQGDRRGWIDEIIEPIQGVGESLKSNQLTGIHSTGESSPTEFQTLDLAVGIAS